MWRALISLGGLGFLFSAVLSVAYAKLAIEMSAKQKQVLDILPGANCGGCGFPGCEGYAATLAKGESSIGLCPVGDESMNIKLAEILGVEAVKVEPKVAILRCGGDKLNTSLRFNYVGIENCIASDIVAEGPKSCTYGCLGYRDCIEVCKFTAISMGDNGLPVINEKECTGCGKCVEACPQDILELVSKAQKVYTACNSPEPMKATKLKCKVGCIGCGLCERNCPYDAIKVVDGRARINFELCQNCGVCVYKCPTHAIVDKLKARPKAIIGTECTGCGKCKEVCKIKAIEGEPGEQHHTILDKCIGCGLCYKVCELKVITMAFSLGYSEAS